MAVADNRVFAIIGMFFWNTFCYLLFLPRPPEEKIKSPFSLGVSQRRYFASSDASMRQDAP